MHSRTLQEGRCESRLVGSCSKSNSDIREHTDTHGVNRIMCLADISENVYFALNPTVARHLKKGSPLTAVLPHTSNLTSFTDVKKVGIQAK